MADRPAGGGWTLPDVPRQDGVSVVITGATSGIGFETARALAGLGARVIIAVRNAARGDDALAIIRAEHPDADVVMGPLDLAEQASVHRFVHWMGDNDRTVDVLINNAGVMAVPRHSTVDGFEMQLATNHLGHFALTGLLLPSLLERHAPRVVTVTSLAHRRGRVDLDDLQSERSYDRMGAYRQSKLANVLFAMELDRRLHRSGNVHASSLAAHPGLADSNLLSGASASGGTTAPFTYALGVIERLAPHVTQSAADGALPCLRAATDPDARGGELYGPAGRGQIKGPAVRVAPARRGCDVHDARALWERSAALTGVPFDELSW